MRISVDSMAFAVVSGRVSRGCVNSTKIRLFVVLTSKAWAREIRDPLVTEPFNEASPTPLSARLRIYEGDNLPILSSLENQSVDLVRLLKTLLVETQRQLNCRKAWINSQTKSII